jgi:hypothetical protein
MDVICRNQRFGSGRVWLRNQISVFVAITAERGGLLPENKRMQLQEHFASESSAVTISNPLLFEPAASSSTTLFDQALND